MTQNNTLSSSQLETDCDFASLKDLPTAKGKSIAHHYFKDKGTVFCSFDLETGGLARKMFEDHQWLFCGMLALTNKKACIRMDASKGALHDVNCGWFCEAVIEKK